MTSNTVGQTGNFGNIIYNSDNDTPTTGRKRIGISATEIELLDDIPPPSQTGITSSKNNISDKKRIFESQPVSSSINKENQINNFSTSSFNKNQPNSNIVHQGNNDQQLNFAVDKLLEKYAPDAIPKNAVNTSTTRRQQPEQANVIKAHNEPSFSTFQTTAPPSSINSNNYSTIIRPNKGQILQTSAIANNNNNNSQPSTRSHPQTLYDTIQYANVPRQPEQKPQTSASVKTNNGNLNQVVPGKLYTVHDDPLHLFYDRQYSNSSKTKSSSQQQQQQQQQPSFQTTFQPSNNFQTTQDPLLSVFTNEPRRNPQQPTSATTTTHNNSNGMPSLDLESLIKRVQQDYYQQIQPFVSSVRFVQKDSEYGQGLADIGFITPISVRRGGFTKQADDILRRSFGQQPQQRPVNLPDPNDYSDDEDYDGINELHSSHRYRPLEKFDSKQSFTSVTSASTYSSDFDDQYSSKYDRKNVTLHDQATSPPPQLNQTKTQSQIQNVPMKPITKNGSNEKDEIGSRPAIPTLARRIPSDQRSITSSEATTFIDEDDSIASYNEHETPKNSPSKPSRAINSIVTNAPLAESLNIGTGRQEIQRSEDIHPIPPTIRGAQANLTSPKDSRTQVKTIESDESDIEQSDSDETDESEDEDQPSAPMTKLPTPSTIRSNVQPTSTSTPTGRSQTAPQTNIRGPGTQTNVRGPGTQTNVRGPGTQTNVRGPGTQANVRDPGTQANVRGPGTTQVNTRGPGTTPVNTRGAGAQNLVSMARSDADNNPRPPTGPTTNPTNIRGESTVAGGSTANTGSTRLFHSDANSKAANKRSVKDSPSTFGNKIKSIFRRKQS
ncbi:unnamed protein product [Rotaria sordida]|uniref:Uncharacterized protein n=1 Tax=Rotaria sordida TaxID=392033 RepID=A0A813YBG2_9BILA|nr:unnamed protein product [Rotaria sordida]